MNTTGEQSIPNCNNRYGITRYKGKYVPCMAKDCSNAAVYDIKIDLLYGHGDFCAGCKRYFEERDLIVSCTTIDLGNGEGKLVKVPTDGDASREESPRGEIF